MAALLGMAPEGGWSAGDERRTPTGRRLDGWHRESYCFQRIGEGDDGALAQCLDSYITELGPWADEIRAFRSMGGSLSFFVSWEPLGDSGETFDADLLLRMGELGIRLELNVV